MIKSDYTLLVVAALIFILGCVAGCEGNKYFNPCRELPTSSVTTETTTKRDTVKVPVPTPVSKGVVKTETVKARKTADKVTSNTEVSKEAQTAENDTPVITDSGEVEIPIEQKTYQTEEYKAVVEGWRPNLVSMEVYPKTTTITKTEVKLKSPRFSLTFGPGVGWDGKEIRPYLGVTAGLILFSK